MNIDIKNGSFVLLVTGGRKFADRDLVWKCLDSLKPTMLIEGGCPTGADALAREWAKSVGLAAWTFTAEWHLYGPRAGPMRNRRMLMEGKPDAVLAFDGGRGTADMVKQSQLAGVMVVVPGEDGGVQMLSCEVPG